MGGIPNDLEHRTVHVGFRHRPSCTSNSSPHPPTRLYALSGPLRTLTRLRLLLDLPSLPQTLQLEARTFDLGTDSSPSPLTLLSLPSYRFVNVTLLPGGKRKMCVSISSPYRSSRWTWEGEKARSGCDCDLDLPPPPFLRPLLLLLKMMLHHNRIVQP